MAGNPHPSQNGIYQVRPMFLSFSVPRERQIYTTLIGKNVFIIRLAFFNLQIFSTQIRPFFWNGIQCLQSTCRLGSRTAEAPLLQVTTTFGFEFQNRILVTTQDMLRHIHVHVFQLQEQEFLKSRISKRNNIHCAYMYQFVDFNYNSFWYGDRTIKSEIPPTLL